MCTGNFPFPVHFLHYKNPVRFGKQGGALPMISLNKKKVVSIVSFAIKMIIALVFIFPLIICLLFALHPEQELSRMPLYFFPQRWTLENFINVFRNTPIFSYLKNTFIVCFVSLTCQVVFGSLAAYAFVYNQSSGVMYLQCWQHCDKTSLERKPVCSMSDVQHHCHI